MLPLPAPATREPRSAERSVARRPGIVFTMSRRFSICHRHARAESGGAWSGPSNNPKNVGMPLLHHPPLLDQLCNSPEIVYFVADGCLRCRHQQYGSRPLHVTLRRRRLAAHRDVWCTPTQGASVLWLTDDSQSSADLRVCAMRKIEQNKDQSE